VLGGRNWLARLDTWAEWPTLVPAWPKPSGSAGPGLKAHHEPGQHGHGGGLAGDGGGPTIQATPTVRCGEEDARRARAARQSGFQGWRDQRLTERGSMVAAADRRRWTTSGARTTG
jgi:hypothetical protein